MKENIKRMIIERAEVAEKLVSRGDTNFIVTDYFRNKDGSFATVKIEVAIA